MNRLSLRVVLSALLVAFAGAATRAGWQDGFFDGRFTAGPPPDFSIEPPLPSGQSRESHERFWAVVQAFDKTERTRLAEKGMSIEEIDDSSVAGVATSKTLERIRAAGFPILRQIALERFQAEGFPPTHKDYHDYLEMRSELNAIASENQGLVSILSAGSSHEGREIAALRFNTTASGTAASDKPGILFVGTHHAREHLSTEVPFLLARWLSRNRDKPDVKRLLDTRDIYIIPMLNPDGVQYDYIPATGKFRWQRKNRRPNQDGSVGTDLNRNYGYHWGEGGASEDPESETYRGPEPFSEPETRAVKKFIEERPNLKILLTYHSFSELVLYPWSYTDTAIPDSQALNAYKAMSKKISGWTGYAAKPSAEIYIASGDMADWAWGARGIFSLTIELTPKSMSAGGFYPGDQALSPVFQKNLQPALYLIELADDPLRAAGKPRKMVPLRESASISQDFSVDRGPHASIIRMGP